MKEKTTKNYEASKAKTVGDKKRVVITANPSKVSKKSKGCSGCSRRRKAK